ncbi:YaiO family outer membrane protein [Collimonas sp. PA-H2]|uniref:YaiO family outer membrane beta-barrel protein n=1 Tax=Collimonas sp. PA-H2 TaxID=1881062 RepID=UPI000C01B5F1|nr:YaiO family outer membrane beta-barrel protein [Collimonas sp. PA-H2]PFH08879.1 YaiO family outer membrane protein [Collimonas sp. PA-H2]
MKTALATLGLSFGCVAFPACASADDSTDIQVPLLQHARLMPLMSTLPAPAAAPIAAAQPRAPAAPAASIAPAILPAPANAVPAALDPAPMPLALAVPVDAAPVAVAPPESTAAAAPELSPELAALELTGGDGHMTNGYGHARLMSLRGMAVTSLGVVQGELTQQSRFGYTGNYGGVSLTHDFSPDYYSTVSVGTGNSPLFSSWRTDATAYRKFGSERQYVAGIGAYYAKGNESARSDKGLLLTGIAYLTGVVIEGGVRLNWADPGSILGPSEYIAATFGNDDRRAVIVRYEHAKETYKVLPGGPELVNFKSNTVNLQWRERINHISMLLAGLEYYQSPLYDRLSLNLGWRWSFR